MIDKPTIHITNVSDLPLIVTRDGVTTVTPPEYASERVIVVGGERTCATCGLWYRQMTGHWGDCDLHNEDDSPVILAATGYAGYKTRDTHHCAGWQRREGAD